MYQNNKTKLIITAIAVIIVLVVLWIFNSREQEVIEVKTPVVKEDTTPQHNCSVGSFTQRIKRGESSTFSVNFEPSREESNYRLKLGDLPRDISAKADKLIGQGAEPVNITISVEPTAQPASYSLVIIYDEEQENGEYVPSECQYNLIVE